LVSAPKSKRGFQKGNTFGRNSRGNPRGNVKHGASSLARGKGETETARRERKLEEAKRARGGKPTRAQYLINFTKQLEAEVDAAIDALGLATHPVGVLLRRRLVENGMAIERLRIYTNNYGVMDKYQRPKPAFLLYLELQQKDRIELRMMLEKLSVFAGDKEGSKPVTWSFENAPEIGIPDQEEEA
jgi:hypothetical protein